MLKTFLLAFLSLFAQSFYGQPQKSDTVYVHTWDAPTISYLCKYYVIGGNRLMRVSISKDSIEKKDTTFYDEIDDETMYLYKGILKREKIRALPIEKVEADMVFDYFCIGDSIDKITKQLGRKKIYVYPGGYKVPFYNKFSKKSEVFDFRFMGGKLWNISRPSTNTLPTNNVWAAFHLIQLKESLEDLEVAIKKLKMKQANRQRK